MMEKKKAKVEIQIHDRIYDVTDFMKTHPGGNILSYMANQDATDAFEAFHYRFSKAFLTLKSLPSRPCPENTRMHLDSKTIALLDDYNVWWRKLEKQGLFKPSYIHVTYRLLEFAAFFVLHYYLLHAGYPILACFVGGLAGGRGGWIQHEGGHVSLTGKKIVDQFIQRVVIAFGLVTFNGTWNKMHNKHHATPQKEEHDPDVDTLPLAALYEGALTRGRRCAATRKYFRLWIRYQHWTFFGISASFDVLFWHFYLHPRDYLVRKLDLITFLLVVLRYVIHFTIAIPIYGFWKSVGLHFLTLWIMGAYLFGNFSLNHTFLPTFLKTDNKDWIRGQLEHTANVTNNFFVNWWMGYLNFQVEHHLFPQAPQFRLAGIQEETKMFFKKHNIPYMQYGYFEAIGKVFTNLKRNAEKSKIVWADESDFKKEKEFEVEKFILDAPDKARAA